jgi:hypothetical protein
MMSYTQQKIRSLDLSLSKRLLGTCWLLATFGIATLQMLLLSMVWHASGHALITALAASAGLLGTGTSYRYPTSGRRWGVAVVVVVLLWFLLSSAVSLEVSTPVFLHLVPLFVLFTTAPGLGFCSTAWLTQQRCWPPVGERFSLTRTLVSTTVGLVLVWLLPNAFWAGGIGFALLIPLLLLDTVPQERSPVLLPESRSARFLLRTARREPGGAAIHLDAAALPRGWWLRYLAARERLPLTYLTSGSTIILGGLWSCIPTPFAAALAGVHQLGKLEWLLGGQVVALAVGCVGLAWGRRGEVSPPVRMLSDVLQTHGRAAVLLFLMVMAAGLVALGLPFLQTPAALCASLGIYTLANLSWCFLLPRLHPSISDEITALRHTHRQPVSSRLLPLRQCEEDLANRSALIAQTWLSALLAPALGWLVDRLTLDHLLVYLGSSMLAAVMATAVAFVIIYGLNPRPPVSLYRWVEGTTTVAVETDGPHARRPA